MVNAREIVLHTVEIASEISRLRSGQDLGRLTVAHVVTRPVMGLASFGYKGLSSLSRLPALPGQPTTPAWIHLRKLARSPRRLEI
jgi:hypothetical protein